MQKLMGITLTWPKKVLLLLVGFLLFAGCRSDGVDRPVAAQITIQKTATATHTAVPTATNTPQPTQEPTQTPTPTPSPTPTPTPTATTLPINITSDLRKSVLSNPEAQSNARCGIVDLLDFPLDPPDAANISYGGQGFGRFRGRYDQYHAGEDWQLTRGRSNLGAPVHAIGHGQVTYAHPVGWGSDQGVIIIRHTFADGSSVLSFYGHMDPDSVILRAGDCVERGQKIAEIGQPRTPPHLHFEIRTHMPDEPGPGYWPVDPTEAGWLPPSQFIWSNRISAMPGVKWTRPFTADGMRNINLVDDDTLIAVEDSQLIGLKVADGSARWQRAISDTVVDVVLDASQSLLYTVDWAGHVTAYPLLEEEEGTTTLSSDPLWQVDSRMMGRPDLQPLPGGGVVVSVREYLVALSTTGDVLWRQNLEQRPFDWLLTDDQLIMTTASDQGTVHSLDASGVQAWPIILSGRPMSVNNQIWLYSHEGLYRLDPAAMTAELLVQLPRSIVAIGSFIALPDGSAIIAHREYGDSRLIAFNPDGTIQWQRSYAQLGARNLQLLLHNDQPYLLMQSGSGIAGQIGLFAIDRQTSTLHHIFSGGSPTLQPSGNWFVSANDDLLLINIGGGSMVALDPDTATSLSDRSAD